MQQRDGGIEPTREGPNPKAIVAIVLVVLVVILAFQNAESAKLHVLFWDADIPIWVVIAGTALTGFIAGWLVGRSRLKRRAMRRRD